MKAVPDTVSLLALCSAYCAATGRSESRVSDLATGNPYFFKRLRAEMGCTVKTYGRVVHWFSDHWPPSVEWPSDIPRPEPRPEGERGKAA